MGRTLAVIMVCIFALSCIWACGPKKVASSNAAIEASKVIKDAKEKADYLISQAKAFYNSKQFEETIKIAQYVLSYVDNNSEQAKSLVEKAKAQLQAMAEQKVNELKGKLGGIGK